jgi:hypothetical protein
MGNSKCLLILAAAVILGNTGCQNPMLSTTLNKYEEYKRNAALVAYAGTRVSENNRASLDAYEKYKRNAARVNTTEKHASVPATQQPTSDAQGVYKWDAATNTYTWLDNVYPQGRSATGTFAKCC